jgi:hypothetical protein
MSWVTFLFLGIARATATTYRPSQGKRTCNSSGFPFYTRIVSESSEKSCVILVKNPFTVVGLIHRCLYYNVLCMSNTDNTGWGNGCHVAPHINPMYFSMRHTVIKRLLQSKYGRGGRKSIEPRSNKYSVQRAYK